MCVSGPPDGALAGVGPQDGCHDIRRVTLLPFSRQRRSAFPADGECPGKRSEAAEGVTPTAADRCWGGGAGRRPRL